MGASVFGIGLSGLNAASLGLSTTGHNIANANTQGYSRQSIKQSAPYPQYTGNGFTGLGVRVDTVQRSYDEFLTKQVQAATSQDSYYGTYLAEIKQVDNLVADPAAGVSPVLQSFFSAVQGISTNPASLPARQSLMSNAQGLVNRFQVFDQRLSEMRAGVNGNLVSAADHVTALSKQIAQINGQIAVSSSGGQLPNDLLDQRDQMVLDLNGLVKATSIKQSDGTINVFIGNGQNLVVGGTAYSIAAKPSISDPQRLSIVYTQGAVDAEIPENMLTGGQLGGLLEYRSKTLDSAQNSIERMALVLGQTFNAQMRQGQDLYGNMGTNFFDYQQSSVSFNHTVAGVSTVAVTASLPAGVKSVASDYSLTFTGTIGAEYSITRLSDNVSQTVNFATMATNPTVLGLTWSVPGVMTAGEKIGVSMPPAIGNVLSNRNNTAAVPPAVAPLLGGYIEDVSKAQPSDYEVFFDGTDYQVTRQSDGQRTQITGAQFVNNANAISVDGLHLSFSQGTPTAGDRFTVQPYVGFSRGLSIKPTDPRVIAAGVPIISDTQRSNTGTGKIGQVAIDPASTVTSQAAVNPQLKNQVDITFSVPTAGPQTGILSYSLADTVSGATVGPLTYVAGQTISYNGWNVKIDGQPAQGDKFSVKAGTSQDADGRNALKLGELQSKKILDGGKANYQEAYGQMVAVIGAKTNEVTIMSAAQTEVLKQAEISRDSVSAVNLDEEAANLLRYQQAYQASSKVIQIAQQAFDAIVRIGG